jgi:hypothetical protein
VYPISLWETDALCSFMAEIRGPVNVFPIPKTLLLIPQTPSLAELAGERPS